MSTDELQFRQLRPTDHEQLETMFVRNALPEVTRHFHPFSLDATTAQRLASYDGRDRYYVADAGGSIVGLSMLRGWDEGYSVPSFGILIDLVFTGRGIGKRMTDFTIERARELGCPRVRLSVYASNDVGYHIYRELGFVEESRTTARTPFGDDVCIVMTKTLDS